eukprot:4476387-Amphidinium_carterae.1
MPMRAGGWCCQSLTRCFASAHLSGKLFVNAGDFMAIASGGRYTSPLHRVVLPTDVVSQAVLDHCHTPAFSSLVTVSTSAAPGKLKEYSCMQAVTLVARATSEFVNDMFIFSIRGYAWWGWLSLVMRAPPHSNTQSVSLPLATYPSLHSLYACGSRTGLLCG